MNYHTLNRGKKQFCCYCFVAFSAEEVLKSHVKDCYGKQVIQIPKKGEYVTP